MGSFLGPWIYGPISDRFGRRPVFLLFLSMQAGAVPVYLSVGGSLALTLGVGFAVGLLQGGLATGVQPMLGELFGTRIRGRAIGVDNAFVRATGCSLDFRAVLRLARPRFAGAFPFGPL